MTAETIVAPDGPAPSQAAEIRLIQLPQVWPPLDTEQALAAWQAAGSGQAASEPAPPGRVPTPAADLGVALPKQFAAFLVECLAGVRPARQLAPWLSKRGALHARRLMPLFSGGHQPRVLRALTTRPAPGVIEMTVVVVSGQRARAIAVRLEQADTPQHWVCTDIEAG
jgi:hypothetical protein